MSDTSSLSDRSDLPTQPQPAHSQTAHSQPTHSQPEYSESAPPANASDNRNLTDFNLSRWNEIVDIHVNSTFYDVEGFLHGQSTLKTVELAELGDVAGKSILHLQCHFGLDSLSLARMGACVTGVDFSDKAIATARRLNDELGLDVRFICSNIYDLAPPPKPTQPAPPPASPLAGETFDIVYTSYGVLCWLPNLDEWARIIAAHLKPGGRFVLVESHPVTNAFEVGADGRLTPQYSYFNREAIECISDRSYTEDDTRVENEKTYQWDHSLSSLLNALIGAGLRLEAVHEHPMCAYNKFPGLMVEDGTGWWRMNNNDFLPLLLSLSATK